MISCVILAILLFQGITPGVGSGEGTTDLVKKSPGSEGEFQQTKNANEHDLEFQEELRSALNSHWEILQHIRYHTLISKMKVAQLDKKVKQLANQLENMDNGVTTSSETSCDDGDDDDEDDDKGEGSEVQSVGEDKKSDKSHQEGKENEMAVLLASLKELSQFYESFNNDTTEGAFRQSGEIEGGFEKLLQLLEKLKRALESRKSLHLNNTKRLTRKSTKVQSGDSLMTSMATTSAMTMMTTSTTTTEEESLRPTSYSEDPTGPDIRGRHTTNVTVDEGATAALICRVVNQGSATVVWTKLNPFGSFDIVSAGQYVFSKDSRYSIIYRKKRDWILTIKSVTRRDDGMYRCEVNSVPPITKNVYLIVQDDAHTSIVADYTQDVSAEVGTTASLNCRVANLRSHDVSWRGVDHYGNSLLLAYGVYSYSSDSRIGVSHQEGSPDWKLTIQRVTKADEGEYSCFINTIPGVSRTISLTVYESQPSSTLSPSPEVNVTVRSGDSVTFNCTAGTSSNDQVFWLHGSSGRIFTTYQAIDTPDQRIFSHYSESETTWSLTVRNVSGADEGVYKCFKSSSTITGSSGSELLQAVHLSIDTRPFIINEDGNRVEAKEGSSALLHCRVGNLGSYTVAWTKFNLNGTLDILTVGLFTFQWNPRLSVILNSSTNDWMLEIKNIELSDKGVYQCQISTHPVVSHSVTLDIVELSPMASSPSHKRNVTVGEGETATFSCHVEDRDDASVSWVRASDIQILTANEFTLSLDSRFKAYSLDNQTWNLQIVNVQREDEGEYLCQVSKDPVVIKRFWLEFNETTQETTSIPVSEREVPSTTSSSANEYCSHPFKMIPGDVCLLHVTMEKLSWEDASSFCKSKGGHLSTDISGSVQAYLVQQHGVEGVNWTMWPFWVGAKEERNVNGERLWRWINGETVESKFWAANQPRRYGKRKAPNGACMTLDGYEGYNSVALPCHFRRRFVCLRNP